MRFSFSFFSVISLSVLRATAGSKRTSLGLLVTCFLRGRGSVPCNHGLAYRSQLYAFREKCLSLLADAAWPSTPGVVSREGRRGWFSAPTWSPGFVPWAGLNPKNRFFAALAETPQPIFSPRKIMFKVSIGCEKYTFRYRHKSTHLFSRWYIIETYMLSLKTWRHL